tara:strand:+ start:454 stop:1080 length:627 start_codon:yes stop_codon:yes gene_type:complete
MSNGKKKIDVPHYAAPEGQQKYSKTGSTSKTKVSTYKRGKHKGEVKKIKTISTDASGNITKQKVKMRGGEITKSKIKKSKKGVLGILGSKKKAKYTKKSGVTVSQVKGKVDPKKVAKKAMTLGAVGVSGAGWPHVAESSMRLATSTFGTKTLASIAGAATAAMTGTIAGALPLASSIGEVGSKSMRTSVKGKVTKGNVVKSEWGKMGA